MKFVIVLLLLSFTRNIIQMVMSDTVGCESDTTCKSWEHCEISYGATKECYGKDCDSDDTCGDGAMCRFGSCVGLRSECDITCKSWEDCISYYDDLYECYGKLCDSDDSCGDGAMCVHGTCANVRYGEVCDSDDTCGDVAKCFYGTCAGLGCESDITCNSWEHCLTYNGDVDECYAKVCDSDDTCGDGAICHVGSCVGLGSECDITCKSWEHCLAYDPYAYDPYDGDVDRCYGKVCDSDDTCGDGATCFHGTCAGLGCESDITCNSWEYCVTFDLGYESCVNKRCDSDDTCGDGATCFSGFNRTECIGCEDVGFWAFHGWIEDLNNFQGVCEKCEDDKNVTNFFSCETQTTPEESTPGESNESPDCTICTDEPTPGMIAKGKMCSEQPNAMKTRCNKKRSWTEAKFCQASCYEAGNGYEGDECCATET